MPPDTISPTLLFANASRLASTAASGTRVVTEGTDRLRAGAKVEILGGAEVIPATRDKTLGAGAPAGTTPASK